MDRDELARAVVADYEQVRRLERRARRWDALSVPSMTLVILVNAIAPAATGLSVVNTLNYTFAVLYALALRRRMFAIARRRRVVAAMGHVAEQARQHLAGRQTNWPMP